jgi:hypothetical protein
MKTEIKFSIVSGTLRVKTALMAGKSLPARDQDGNDYVITIVDGVPALRSLNEKNELSSTPSPVLVRIHQ